MYIRLQILDKMNCEHILSMFDNTVMFAVTVYLKNNVNRKQTNKQTNKQTIKQTNMYCTFIYNTWNI